MATEVAQIPAEETPAVAAAAAATTENAAAEQAEKPAAEPVAVAAAVAENAAANNAQDNNKEDAKASPAAAAADGAAAADAKKDGGDVAAAPAKSEAPAQKFNVHKTNFEKDIIYLYQFSRTPLLPSLSPYCLKVETWLRLVALKYEVNFPISHISSIMFSIYLSVLLNVKHILKFLHDFPISLAGFSSSNFFSPSIHAYICIFAVEIFSTHTHTYTGTRTPIHKNRHDCVLSL